jgi:hypothetical protein
MSTTPVVRSSHALDVWRREQSARAVHETGRMQKADESEDHVDGGQGQRLRNDTRVRVDASGVQLTYTYMGI